MQRGMIILNAQCVALLDQYFQQIDDTPLAVIKLEFSGEFLQHVKQKWSAQVRELYFNFMDIADNISKLAGDVKSPANYDHLFKAVLNHYLFSLYYKYQKENSAVIFRHFFKLLAKESCEDKGSNDDEYCWKDFEDFIERKVSPPSFITQDFYEEFNDLFVLYKK